MGKCDLCEGNASWMGCKNCGLRSIKQKKDCYEFVFKRKKITLPAEKDISLEDFIKKNKETILNSIEEEKMAAVGYFKGRMCPFTQVKVGGTKAATLAFTGASMNEFTWTHSECLQKYCAIWDIKNKQCSIMTIAKKLQ
ncbi:hypothetical protein HYU40_01890 [Candidatus Woesearchaeota archaeon]|nr:hypothetical protein [Candidatus Woesearchaeota archaeon]